jgi:hypothetical protein
VALKDNKEDVTVTNQASGQTAIHLVGCCQQQGFLKWGHGWPQRHCACGPESGSFAETEACYRMASEVASDGEDL